MSTHNALFSVNRSLLLVLSTLSVACQPIQLGCPDGFVLTPEGRCVGVDAGAMPVGDGGPVVETDAGTDAAMIAADAAVDMPDAYVEMADACAWGTWYADHDADGFGDPSMPVSACAQPAGTVSAPTDCADADATRHPEATEVCNTVDDDCDGATDEGLTHTYYADCDGDTFAASSATPLVACPTPPPPACVGLGTVRHWTETAPSSIATADCNDSAASARPDNAWYPDCDGDNFAAATATATISCNAPTTQACATAPASTPGGRWTLQAPTSGATDCYDFEAHAYPGSLYSSASAYTTGVGSSYDYNCDGVATAINTAVDDGACHMSLTTHTCSPATPTWVGAVPACGSAGPMYHCGGSACSATTASYLPICH